MSNRIYDTNAMKVIASWENKKEQTNETLYFAENGKYLLHCTGNMAKFKNEYGSVGFSNEDLILLQEEDVIGWLDVHSPESLNALYPKEDTFAAI